jgi:hypothetical protein
MAGVHFMAETAKLLNPGKTVLIPDLRAGCSLAESITGSDVRLLRQRYPGVPVVSYVNTSAEVKAESDICCTSSNAVAVVESLRADRVIFLPDQYLGRCHGHRVLDVRQRRCGGQRRRIRATLQSLPAHEAHHARRDRGLSSSPAPRGKDPSKRRRARPSGRCAHDGNFRVIAHDFIVGRAVVVGGGIAGLATALSLDGCILVANEPIGHGASSLAQGGIAAALGRDDSPALHAFDTLRVAAEIADPAIASLVADAAAGRIDWLRSIGVAFDASPSGEPALGREA